MQSNPLMALSLPTPIVVLPLVPLILVFIYLSKKSSEFAARSQGRPLPPGPPGIPVLGNLFDLPKSSPWLGYRDICQKYGASPTANDGVPVISRSKRREPSPLAGHGPLHSPRQRPQDRLRPL